MTLWHNLSWPGSTLLYLCSSILHMWWFSNTLPILCKLLCWFQMDLVCVITWLGMTHGQWLVTFWSQTMLHFKAHSVKDFAFFAELTSWPFDHSHKLQNDLLILQYVIGLIGLPIKYINYFLANANDSWWAYLYLTCLIVHIQWPFNDQRIMCNKY